MPWDLETKRPKDTGRYVVRSARGFGIDTTGRARHEEVCCMVMDSARNYAVVASFTRALTGITYNTAYKHVYKSAHAVARELNRLHTAWEAAG